MFKRSTARGCVVRRRCRCFVGAFATGGKFELQPATELGIEACSRSTNQNRPFTEFYCHVDFSKRISEDGA